MKTCPNCNTFNPDKAVRCVSCSSPLDHGSSPKAGEEKNDSFARSTFMGIPRGSSPGQPSISPRPPESRGTMMGLPAFQASDRQRVPGTQHSADEETVTFEHQAPPPAQTRAAGSGVSGAWARRSLPELTRRALSSDEHTFTEGPAKPFAPLDSSDSSAQDPARRTMFGFGRSTPNVPPSGPMRAFSRPESNPLQDRKGPAPSPRQTQFSFPAGPNDPNAGLGDVHVSQRSESPASQRWNIRNSIRNKQTMPIPRLAFSEEELAQEPKPQGPSTRRARPLSLTMSGPPTHMQQRPSQPTEENAIFKLPRNPLSAKANPPEQGRQTMMGMRAVQPMTDATGEFQFNPDGFRFHGANLGVAEPDPTAQRAPGGVADDLDDFEDLDESSNPLVSTMSGMRTFSRDDAELLGEHGLVSEEANEGLDDAIAMALEDVLAQSFDLSDDLDPDIPISDPEALFASLPQLKTPAESSEPLPPVSPDLIPLEPLSETPSVETPLSGIVRPAKARPLPQSLSPLVSSATSDPDSTVADTPSTSLLDELRLGDSGADGWGSIPESLPEIQGSAHDLEDPFAPTQAVDIPLFDDPLFGNSSVEEPPAQEPFLLTDPIAQPEQTPPEVAAPPISQPPSAATSTPVAPAPPVAVSPPVAAPPPPVSEPSNALALRQDLAPVAWHRSCMARIGLGAVLLASIGGSLVALSVELFS